MHRTVSEWAADAAGCIQSACNLAGLVFAFERCVEDLSDEARRLGKNQEWIDHHSICVAWADKLDDLSRSRSLPPIPTDEHLVGVVLQFARAMREICSEAQRLNHGTDWRNQHPVVQSFVRRIVSITRSREGLRVFDALADCERLTNVVAAD